MLGADGELIDVDPAGIWKDAAAADANKSGELKSEESQYDRHGRHKDVFTQHITDSHDKITGILSDKEALSLITGLASLSI